MGAVKKLEFEELKISDEELKKELAQHSYDFNQQWKDFWQKDFESRYKEEDFFKENKFLKTKIGEVIKINDNLFEENINLGEQFEKIKQKNKNLISQLELLTIKYNEMVATYKEEVEPLSKSGFKFELKKKDNLISLLQNKIKSLESQNNFSKASLVDADTLIINKIIALNLQNKSQKDIATILNISQASVSRYLGKKEVKKEIARQQANTISNN